MLLLVLQHVDWGSFNFFVLGLFHKAIVQSGGIYCPLGYTGHQRKMKLHYEQQYDLLQEDETRNMLLNSLKPMQAAELAKIVAKVISRKSNLVCDHHCHQTTNGYKKFSFDYNTCLKNDLLFYFSFIDSYKTWVYTWVRRLNVFQKVLFCPRTMKWKNW